MHSVLKTILDSTAEALTRNPDAARVRFAAGGELVGVFEVDVTVGGHRLQVDEPRSIGGGGSAPNPVQYALASLGSCQAITYRMWAEKLGVRLDRVRVEVTGDMDVRGFQGLGDGVRAGFDQVEVRVYLGGPEPPGRYEELRRAVDEHCPVLDIFLNKVPVRTSLTIA